MAGIKSLGFILVVSLFVHSLPAQETKPEATRKLTKGAAKSLLGRWLANKRYSPDARKLLEQTRVEDRKNIMAAFAKGTFQTPKKKPKTGFRTLKIEAQEGIAAGEYLIDIPKKYSGKKA